ncbi:MAG: hypothetical protein WCO78_01425 [Candidatus Roizmanbacteria bacterium]
MKFTSDSYKRSRRGYSRLLDITCASCSAHMFDYQKDGPGILMRLYLDRIFRSSTYSDRQNQSLSSIPPLTCAKCNKLLGVPYIFQKENRLAFRLFAGAVAKRIIKS